MRSIPICFHVKYNWLINLLFLFTFSPFMRLFDSSYLEFLDNLNLPFHLSLFIEMPSLKRKATVAWLEDTRLHASRHRRSSSVLKCSNCNFYTYSTEEFTNLIKKKHSSCQLKVKLCAQQSQNTLQEKVKFISFLFNNFH